MFSECDDTARFKIVHCGVTVGKYRYRSPRKTVKTLFCTTRLSPEKGLTFIIRGMSLLFRKGYDLELRLGGDGPSKGRLQELATQLGIADRVHFLGFLTEDEIVRELESSDLFVLPSLVEGIPVSAMEAMAVGVPVIATNIAGTSELIEDGKTGLLVRPSDPEALAEAVIRMIGDHPFRLRAAELGRQKVVDEFDVDKEATKLRRHLLENCDPAVDHRVGNLHAESPAPVAPFS